MTGWTVPPSAAVPPGVGLAPPPGVGMAYQPEDERPEEENLVRQHDWALQDAEADQHKSTDQLRREAERTRERVNDSVVALRERLGLDPDAAHAHGPFAPVRRHPLTVAIAAAGTATAAVVGVTVLRSHRKSDREKQAAREMASGAAKSAVDEMIKAAHRRRKAAAKAARHGRKATGKRLDAVTHVFGSAAKTADKKRKKAVHRLLHH